ncbi:type II secretion system protein GspG [Akkermansiaceae bacterium]|nr:type II secretion system protein GspG [Akkermansiaceae bacterium]
MKYLTATSAVIFSLLFLPSCKDGETTKKTEALQCISNLIYACDAFFEEYQALPMATTSATDAEQVTDNRLMARLLGLKVASDENPKLKKFFSWKAAKGTGNSAVGGLVRTETTASLVDPWGNFYRVVFNYDNDDILREPQATGRNEIIYDRRVLAYSLGPDGIAGGKGEKDNIYSWNVYRE